MKFIDLFAGVGGFRRGMELAGHECVGFCEWDKFATASYTSMHLITEQQRSRLADMDLKARQKEILKEEYRNGEWYSADVRLITADNVPRADCWCFGAPCQDFSIAGQRKGLGGTEVPSFEKYFGYLGNSKKKIDLNGLSTKMLRECLAAIEGGDFGAILLEMGELGYDTEWQLFNTKNFGVPQNRERVYTIGHLRSRGRKQIFPLKNSDRQDCICEVKQMGMINANRHNPQRYRVYETDGISPALTTMGDGGLEPHIPAMVSLKNGIEKETDISHTLLSRDYKGLANLQAKAAVVIPVLTPDRTEKRQNGRRFKENGDESFTLTAQDRHGVALKVKEATKQGYAIAHEGDSINLSMPESKTRRGRVENQVAQTLDCGCNQGIFVKLNENTTVYAVWYEKYQCYIAIRKLTPRECFRLQGWTDDYFEKAAFVNSDSQLYKQAGNGVTVDVVKAIAEQLSFFEEE